MDNDNDTIIDLLDMDSLPRLYREDIPPMDMERRKSEMGLGRVMDYDVRIHRYWTNKLFCWHGKKNRRIMSVSNGAVSYCDKCKMKHIGLHDFGTARFK